MRPVVVLYNQKEGGRPGERGGRGHRRAGGLPPKLNKEDLMDWDNLGIFAQEQAMAEVNWESEEDWPEDLWED